MSRFNNPRALETLQPPPPARARMASVSDFFRRTQAPDSPVVPVPVLSSEAPSILQQICFVLVCLFVLSLYANDLSTMLFGVKAYISTVCLFLVPVAYLATGTPFRGLRTSMGLLWLGFGAWLLVAAPFSVWRGGTFQTLISYYPHAFMMLFYVAACAISINQCRRFLFTLSIGAFVVLVCCFKFGSMVGDRFTLPDSVFFSNANELALQLALGIAFMIFFFFTRSFILKVVGIAGIALSLRYMLKTGSRGVFLAVAVMALVVFLFSRYKIQIIALGVPITLVAFAFIPPATRDRLLFIRTDSSAEVTVSSELELSALESQLQRERLLRMSLELTLTHPLVGVGPDQFAVAAAGESEKKGAHSEWRGTHNTYTQVSSEAGLPAFVFYTSALFLGLVANYRRYRAASAKNLTDIAGLSFSLFLATLVYAVATIFFHIAYSSYLPIMLGLTIALELAARPILAPQSPQ
jgi:O-antigen ligase